MPVLRVPTRDGRMLIPSFIRSIPESVGGFVASVLNWSPIGQPVRVLIEVSEDPYLAGRSMRGTIRAADDTSGALLIELAGLLGKLEPESFFDVVAATPVLRWHRPVRLLVASMVVRFVRASAFPLDQRAYTIGTGRVLLTNSVRDPQ